MQHPGQRWLDNEMFDAGVTRGMLCAWYGPQGPMIDNDDATPYPT